MILQRSKYSCAALFDGFRTSHEVMKIVDLDDDTMRAMIDDELVHAHRRRALSPYIIAKSGIPAELAF